jgi:diaminopimelate decarboxylase
MDHFRYQDGELCAENVPLRVIAERYGTPCYVYSRATLERHWRAFDQAFGQHPHLICFAVKANSNLGVLNTLARLGSGFDIVSVGELERVLAAGGDPAKVVFSGVGKRAAEMRRALENKFGIAVDDAAALYRQAQDAPHLAVSGVDCHIGSQLTRLAPFLDALERVLALVTRLADDGITIDHLDLGGGLGVRYDDESPPEPAAYASAILHRLRDAPYQILIEPGRAIAANAGILLTRVEYLKHGEVKDFAVIDAAMNDLIRPALYQAWQAIVSVDEHPGGAAGTYDIVGPICETGDFLGKQRRLTLSQDSLLAIRSSGAYGFTMSSNYNSRPRAAEVMVDGDRLHLVRRRETLSELFAGESVLPD